jgi:CRP/FNR family transcriptional regulator, cyclic AMP receptor protein
VKVDDEVVAALRRISLFHALDGSTLASIAQQITVFHFPAGSSVIDADSSGRFRRLYSVVNGTAEARVDGEVVATLGPGDSFGEMSVLDGRPRSAAVVATTDLRTLGLSSWNMRHCCGKNPRSR